MTTSPSSAAAGLSSTLVALVLVGGLTWLTGNGESELAGWPLVCVVGALAVLVQWIAWVPAAIARTEKYFDLTGSVTYLVTTGVAFALGGRGPRAALVTLAVALWASRLGTFLFTRIRRDGKDGRMDHLKVDPLRFLMVWNIQAVWVSLTALAAWTILAQRDAPPLGLLDALGFVIFLLGFAIEVVADRQKYAFSAKPENAGRFIDEGLWSWSQHPNYFGEITLWTGIAVVGMSVYEGAQWVALISPLFVFVLLTRISGIPLLDARAKKKWGDDAAYRAYRERTRVLLLWPPRRERGTIPGAVIAGRARWSSPRRARSIPRTRDGSRAARASPPCNG